MSKAMTTPRNKVSGIKVKEIVDKPTLYRSVTRKTDLKTAASSRGSLVTAVVDSNRYKLKKNATLKSSQVLSSMMTQDVSASIVSSPYCEELQHKFVKVKSIKLRASSGKKNKSILGEMEDKNILRGIAEDTTVGSSMLNFNSIDMHSELRNMPSSTLTDELKHTLTKLLPKKEMHRRRA